MLRTSVQLSLALLLTVTAYAKSKDKVLPADVLDAQTVMVVIHPEAGEPLIDPNANSKAKENVEGALAKWGRFRIVMEPQIADLVLAVRKGNGRVISPTIRGGPIDNRPPVILQPTEDGGVRVGTQSRRAPDVTHPDLGGPSDTVPRVGGETGPAEDMLEVYRGRVEYPLDNTPVWRYVVKDGLRAPKVPAVDQFRRAIDQAQKTGTQKQHKQKP